jgi:hypothetical protein
MEHQKLLIRLQRINNQGGFGSDSPVDCTQFVDDCIRQSAARLAATLSVMRQVPEHPSQNELDKHNDLNIIVEKELESMSGHTVMVIENRAMSLTQIKRSNLWKIVLLGNTSSFFCLSFLRCFFCCFVAIFANSSQVGTWQFS